MPFCYFGWAIFMKPLVRMLSLHHRSWVLPLPKEIMVPQLRMNLPVFRIMHWILTYINLVKAGYRVAICDQLEDPKLAKGIVKRGVTEMVTPGIATNDKLLEHNSNNFLAGIHFADDNSALLFSIFQPVNFLLRKAIRNMLINYCKRLNLLK